ncbi:MAG: GrpB family protein [Actinomycetota bacterium]
MAPFPVIVDYRSTWPDRFDVIAALIGDALGPRAMRIDHIGSTAVPGLCAKDIIDVQITVGDLDTDAITPPMERAGLRSRPTIVGDHQPPGWVGNDEEWSKLYFDTADGNIHVHVRVTGRANQRYALLFRDYLRAHAQAAAAYGELKRRLAVLCPDTLTYADAKDPVCDIIMSAAQEWADRTGWRT